MANIIGVAMAASSGVSSRNGNNGSIGMAAYVYHGANNERNISIIAGASAWRMWRRIAACQQQWRRHGSMAV